MTTTIPNTRTTQPITIDQIQANIDKAQQSFVLSKNSATEAAAHLYVVWDDTSSPFANADAKKWIGDQIEARNKEIDEHNEKVASDRKRAKAFKAGTLSKDDLINTTPANDAGRKDVDEERARLTSLADLTDDEWMARRKVLVKAQANSSPFTAIVKFGLNFDSPAHASVTSRYATVLEWIHTRFEGVEIEDTSEIVTAIKVAGGFETVLIEHRNKGESGGSKGAEEREIEAEERKIIEKAIAAKAKAAVQTAPAIATIDMQISNANQDIVVLIGRYADGKVEVVDEIPLEAGEIDLMIPRVSDDLLPPANESTEFIARVLALGDIVGEGKATDKTRDETVMGEKLVEERTLSLLPDGEENIQLVISALHADSSAVIKATPEPSRVNLGIVADDGSVSAEGNSAQSTISWIASNSALIAEEHQNGRQMFTWENMTQHDSRPLDVDNFQPLFTVSVSATDMLNLYRERLETWHGKVDNKKIDKLMTLSFRETSMTYKVDGDQDLETSCVGTIPVPVTLQFRSRDLLELVLKLNEQHTQTFDVSGDDGGLLCVSWSDHLGSYSVYMPTSTTDGRQQPRRVAPMRVSLSKAAA
jgi:hypothetical protein